MADTPSLSRLRITVAQFLMANNIEIDQLYAALGADAAESDGEALAHIAGVIDGMSVASTRIRQHGLDNWAKDI